MLYYLVAVLLLAHAVFWGAGLALMLLPKGGRRSWWIWAAPLGWALQSAVVWVGAHLPWAGTNVYALATELIPLTLIGIASRRMSWRCSGHAVTVAAAIFLAGSWMLLMPLAKRGAWTLTTASLGSCDQADYAAGARVLQEFARSDRVGFMDLPEVTRIGGVERFFDYWLELNHFSPSAIIAHNGTVFGLQTHQSVSITAAVFWLGLAPLAWLLSRELGWRPRRRWLAGTALAFSPLGHYAVHHGAMGQMLAGQGIAMLTVIIAGMVRRRPAWSPGRAAALALPAFWLIAGSYNFILVIALAPAVGGLLLVAAIRRDPRLLARVALPLAAALACCAVLFFGRFVGIAERFRLLDHYSFGWPVPVLWPEGWLGLVREPDLDPWGGTIRLSVLAAVLSAAAFGWWKCWCRSREQAGLAAGWALAIAAGWAVLVCESHERVNASYDAFKVVTLFLPLLVPVLLLWFGQARGKLVWVGATLAVAWAAACAVPISRIQQRMVVTPLRVTPSILALERLEDMPRVTSINMLIDDFWARLWANALLLRKPQYFLTHTYEARRNTELRGEWNLRDSLIHSLPENRRDGVALNPRFHAVRASLRNFVQMDFGEGWHTVEQGGAYRWRWSDGPRADFELINSGSNESELQLMLRLRSAVAGNVTLRLDGELVERRHVGIDWVEWEIDSLRVPSGRSRLSIEVESSFRPGGRLDPRELGIAVSRGVISPVE